MSSTLARVGQVVAALAGGSDGDGVAVQQCVCGCGKEVRAPRRYATATCRSRARRHRVDVHLDAIAGWEDRLAALDQWASEWEQRAAELEAEVQILQGGTSEALARIEARIAAVELRLDRAADRELQAEAERTSVAERVDHLAKAIASLETEAAARGAS